MKKPSNAVLVSKSGIQDLHPSLKTTHIAAYTESMLASLVKMTRESDLPVLSYLIDMARLEAENNIE